MKTALAALLFSTMLPASALAQNAGVQMTAPPPQHSVAVTFSPLHLAMPIIEVTGELRASDKLGVAAIVGGGSIDSGGTTFKAWEAGGQVRYYLLGSFEHGMQLGAEVLYVGVSGDDIAGTKISGAGAGLAVGPFLGYKYTAGIGFTFDCQVGAEKVAIAADTSNGAHDDQQSVIPLLNLNVGWSF